MSTTATQTIVAAPKKRPAVSHKVPARPVTSGKAPRGPAMKAPRAGVSKKAVMMQRARSERKTSDRGFPYTSVANMCHAAGWIGGTKSANNQKMLGKEAEENLEAMTIRGTLITRYLGRSNVTAEIMQYVIDGLYPRTVYVTPSRVPGGSSTKAEKK